MLSIDLIRRETERVRQALALRGEGEVLEPLLALDARRRALVTQRDGLRSQHNELSREFGRRAARARGEGDGQEALDALRSRTGDLSDAIRDLEAQVGDVESEMEATLLRIPNLPLPSVPIGADESANRVVRTWGEPRAFDFEPLPHWELGERLGIIDLARGAKLSGSRFFVLRGAAARLERALIAWMLDVHTREHGYVEVALPYLVRGATLVGSGNLPKFGDNLYHDAEEDLWLIPTAEAPLTGLHQNELLEPGTLPIRYVACTPCFRREKAAAGRDTRGIKRVHQFDKVEMYKLVEPQTSESEHERLVADAEDLCQRLGLPYRVVELCTGDLGFASARTFDIEVWAAGCGEWLEVSSCSNCTDFQARRANIRHRPEPGARPQYVHTLNGSGLALPRVLIALLENGQRRDGTVEVPGVLRPFAGMDIIVRE